MHLDNMFSLGKMPEELNHNFTLAKSLLIYLGFLVNEEKSVPGPTQELEFLGFVINSRMMTLAVMDKKMKSLISQYKALMEATSHHNSATCSSHRCNNFNDTSCTSSTSPLSGSPTTEKCSLGPPPHTDYSDSGSQTGPDLVDTTKTVEISEYSIKETSSDTGVRCFQPWLGGSVPQPENIDGRCMECDRHDTPHRLQGTFCSMVGPSVLCLEPTERTYTSSDR